MPSWTASPRTNQCSHSQEIEEESRSHHHHQSPVHLPGERPLLDARKRYREAKSNAPVHRRSHLESLPPKQRNRYLRVEEQRRQGTIARSITGKLKGARVSMVTTQNPDGQMTHHTTKRAVEDAIIDANKFKYSQSTDTPPMQPSFVAEFGYTGNTPAAEAVLNGTVNLCPPT